MSGMAASTRSNFAVTGTSHALARSTDRRTLVRGMCAFAVNAIHRTTKRGDVSRGPTLGTGKFEARLEFVTTFTTMCADLRSTVGVNVTIISAALANNGPTIVLRMSGDTAALAAIVLQTPLFDVSGFAAFRAGFRFVAATCIVAKPVAHSARLPLSAARASMFSFGGRISTLAVEDTIDKIQLFRTRRTQVGIVSGHFLKLCCCLVCCGFKLIVHATEESLRNATTVVLKTCS